MVEESWPAYDHVNVQVGLDAWLARAGRTHRARRADQLPAPGVRARRPAVQPCTATTTARARATSPASNLASGPDGQVRPAVRAGLYLVDDGGTRTAVLVLARRPRSAARGWLGCTWSSSRPGRGRRGRRRGPHARGRAQRLPWPGALVRPARCSASAARRPAVPPPAHRVGAGRDPAPRDAGRDHPSGGRGRPSTATGCSPPASTSSAGCCSTGPPASARRTRCAT